LVAAICFSRSREASSANPVRWEMGKGMEESAAER